MRNQIVGTTMPVLEFMLDPQSFPDTLCPSKSDLVANT